MGGGGRDTDLVLTFVQQAGLTGCVGAMERAEGFPGS